jgi:hypothetical protein
MVILKNDFMDKFKKLLLTLFIMSGLLSCDEFRDDVMTLQKQPYLGNELRTDGYYYYWHENNICIAPHFFYKNGCSLVIPGTYSDLKEAEEKIEHSYIQNLAYRDAQYHWGSFHINGNHIMMQYYQGDNYRTIVKVKEGRILNDITFQMILCYRVNGEDRENINEIYHFRQFSPKPDSTNKWIK